MTTPSRKRSRAAAAWLVAALVLTGMFALDYWIQGDATPLGSFTFGLGAGAAAILAWGARRRARAR